MVELYKPQIKGYVYGKAEVPKAPISKEELKLLLDSALWTQEDEENRKIIGEVIKENMSDMLNQIVSYFGSRDYLIYYFKDERGETTETEYVNNTVDRLAQWLLDICFRPIDENFVNYQYLIGIRHTFDGKGKADNVKTIPHIPMRYMITCIFPVTAVIRSFLERKFDDPKIVEKLYDTWFKLQVITTAFFCAHYTKEGWW